MGALNPLGIEGPAGSGKTQALLELMRESGGAFASESVVLLTSRAQIPAARERLRALGADADRFTLATFGEFALNILRAGRPAGALRVFEATEAAALFAQSCEGLADLQFLDLFGAELDPEISGLRSPDRFCAAALALIGKLRQAGIDPEGFERAAMRGTTTFYAEPPNFSDLDLVLFTKDDHRASLSVDAAELDRQRQREIDLTKVLAGLYRRYLQRFSGPIVFERDLAPLALDRALAEPEIAGRVRAGIGLLCVDDAHECTAAEFGLLGAIFGPELHGVAFAFDESQAIGAFAGARPKLWKDLRAERRLLARNHRTPDDVIALASDFLTKATTITPVISNANIVLFHTLEKRDEAAFIADRIAALIEAGNSPDTIAVIARTLQHAGAYERALLARNVPLDLCGDASPYRQAAALDALAALWTACNPYRHEWLLRFLQAPPLALSDALLALLCGDPPAPQGSLFDERTDPASADPVHRSLRLARNVFGGERDGELADGVRTALAHLRELQAQWVATLERDPPIASARAILAQAGSLRPDENATPAQQSADARASADLLEAIERFTFVHPDAQLEDFLLHAERSAAAEGGRSDRAPAPGTVGMFDVDSARGLEFDHVFVCNVHAGAFPRYYTPEAFLFSPGIGMIAKDNAGGTQAARTAKYSYYEFRFKPAAAYYELERRRLYVAMMRARRSLTITASDRPTRARSAPEFLTELRALRPEFALPG